MDGMGEKPAGMGYKQYADPSSIYRAYIWGILKICLDFMYVYI